MLSSWVHKPFFILSLTAWFMTTWQHGQSFHITDPLWGEPTYNQYITNNTNNLKTTATNIKYFLDQLHNQPVPKEGATTTTTRTTQQPCTARPTKDSSPPATTGRTQWWWLPSQRAPNALTISSLLGWTSCWTNNCAAIDLRHHDAHVTPLYIAKHQ